LFVETSAGSSSLLQSRDEPGIHAIAQAIIDAMENRHTAATYHINVDQSKVTFGDEYSNIGAGAAIINRSSIEGSLNRLQQTGDPAAAMAGQEIIAMVERSGHRDALAALQALSRALERRDAEPGVLKILWKGLLEYLPALLELPAAAIFAARVLQA
jgi:hypothetical protein